MDAIREIWETPALEWRDPSQLSLDEQTAEFEAAVTGLAQWAKNKVDAFMDLHKGEDAQYNLLFLRSFADATPGGRPDLPDMLQLEDLLCLLLSWGPHYKKVQIETVLVATHAKIALRKPVCPDDLYWLGFQAKQLNAFRNKCFFVKKYPQRIAHRLGLLSDADLKSFANILQKMSWVKVLEPLVAQATPALSPPATEKTQSDPAPSPLSDVAPASPAPLTSGASPLTPAPLTDLRIPSIFLDSPAPDDPVQKKTLKFTLRHEEDLLAKAARMPPRPVHHGAATENFGKKLGPVDPHSNLCL